MSENAWLIKHAIDNVWCDPSADGRVVMQLARIGSPEGETFGMRVSEISIKLPQDGLWYQVYQIGNMSTDYVGIPQLWDGWARLDRVINAYGTDIKIYDGAGRVYPSALIWIRQLANDNVILAIESADNLIDLKTTTIYVSFYDGEFRNSPDYANEYKNTVYYKIPNNQLELENLVRSYQAEKLKEGSVQAYVNCKAVYELTNRTCNIWDHVEYRRDGIVKETHEFKVSDLVTFDSKLDLGRKYLLHPDKGCDMIEFNNDIELYIFNGEEGRYYYVHKKASIRQLTHHDYAIPAMAVQNIVQEAGWANTDNLTIRLNIRRSGNAHQLIHEKLLLLELYKLPNQRIIDAMAGINSTVEEWQAANLETSSFYKLMSARYENITKPLCTDAYGYDGITKYLSDMPIKMADNGTFTLPPLHFGKVSVYEYDRAGKLLGVNLINHSGVDEYRPHNPACGIIEPLIGKGENQPTVIYDVDLFKPNPYLNYRYYKCPNKNGVATYKNYVDITGTDEYSHNDKGEVVWRFDRSLFTPVMVDDFNFLSHKVSFDINEGDIRFTIRADQDLDRDVPFSPKTLDVFLGNVSLIPDVDYHVSWPEIVIYSKERLAPYLNKTVDIEVRAIGLAKAYQSVTHGFIIDGLLSVNNKFDLRDNKVCRIIVDGSLKVRSDVTFGEDASVAIEGYANGLPYVINDTMIPLMDVVAPEADDYQLKEWDESYTKKVEAYLTLFMPTRPTIEHNPIPKRYRAFSPILNKVIADLRSARLVPVIDDNVNYISTQQFDTLMEQYLPYLKFDPIRLGVDDRYVVTEPHVYPTAVELSPLQYSLIERINDRYLGSKIILNKLITVKG